jgi:hypothetical protein
MAGGCLLGGFSGSDPLSPQNAEIQDGPTAAGKVGGFANHPFHSLFPSVRSTGDFGQHGLLACLASNFYQILQINSNDESKRTRAHLVLLFGCGSSRLYFLSRISVLQQYR